MQFISLPDKSTWLSGFKRDYLTLEIFWLKNPDVFERIRSSLIIPGCSIGSSSSVISFCFIFLIFLIFGFGTSEQNSPLQTPTQMHFPIFVLHLPPFWHRRLHCFIWQFPEISFSKNREKSEIMKILENLESLQKLWKIVKIEKFCEVKNFYLLYILLRIRIFWFLCCIHHDYCNYSVGKLLFYNLPRSTLCDIHIVRFVRYKCRSCHNLRDIVNANSPIRQMISNIDRFRFYRYRSHVQNNRSDRF